MGNGLAIMTGAQADTSIYPYFGDDRILTDNGSLVLVDFAHSANPLVGVPASGTTLNAIPNIAWKEAAALVGAGTQTEWAMSSNVNLTASDGFIERSGKGGIHVCMSQATGSGSNKGFAVRRQTTDAGRLLAYLYANLGNTFYFSRWERITRVALTTSPEAAEAVVYAASAGSPFSTGLLTLNRVGLVNAASSFDSPAVPQVVGPSFRAGSFAGWSAGGRPSSAADIVAALFAVGQNPAAYGGSSLINKSRSAVLYRCYLEDLTASGRTFAQVQAIDKQMFDAAFASGGRFYGDTYTAVSTLP